MSPIFVYKKMPLVLGLILGPISRYGRMMREIRGIGADAMC